ncbi:hypothetical protein GCM10027275_37470 [Rhabdobacter roseus]
MVVLLFLAGTLSAFYAFDAQEDPFASPRVVSQEPVLVPLPPDEALKTFRLPKGYRLEVVASEPMISEPLALAWDGNARLYVAQMETYMQDVAGSGEREARSRIMLLEDTDNDGKMDKSSVFIDQLVLPRMILCVGREVLVNETDTYDIYAYEDTNGDGKADKKRPVYQSEQKAYGNVEHQRSGLDWNLDNWIYQTVDPVRFRYKKGKLVADTLISGSNGQWGLTHDNYGRLFFCRAAPENVGSGFQINPKYGQLEFADAYNEAEFGAVWPIVKTPDVNGGAGKLRPDSTMAHVTAACGQSIFRGDRLPQSLHGDYLVAEPVARVIRRANVTTRNGKTTLANVYHQDEFIASTDLNFRPVNTYTGPDGCLYIVDMYRGIIQQATWAQPGSYLYGQIMSKGLDKNIKNGRIYRLVYEGIEPGPKPRLLDEPTAALVKYLDHPNGWWRDNAQKELIVRNEKKVVEVLRKKALGQEQGTSPLGRLHALWTLEGLEAVDKALLLPLLTDRDAQLRKAAIWISEPYLQKNDAQVLAKLQTLVADESDDVLVQLRLSLSVATAAQAQKMVAALRARKPSHEMLTGIEESLRKKEEVKKYGYKLMSLAEPVRKSVLEGATIFGTLCATCHGPEGQGTPTQLAPPLIGKFKLIENKEEVIKIMLHGLKGPVDGEKYSEHMPPMGSNSDEWIAAVLNYVRYDLCMRSFPEMNEGYRNWVIVKPEQVQAVREKTTDRREPWTWEELMAAKKNQKK